jgi:hypothetical protein
MTNLVALAAKECNLSEHWVRAVLRSGPSDVKKIPVPHKRKPGFRLVSRPSAELEILQRWLVLRFFRRNRVHPMAMAFLPKKSILLNANFHKNNNYFIRIDFKDFFPSIRMSDLVKALIDDRGCVDPLIQYDGYREFLARVCFDFSDTLPIGYISSPAISNLVMWGFDTKLSELVAMKKSVIGDGLVTRYADDIVFSTNLRGGCQKFLELFRPLVEMNTYPRLRINEEKTAFSSKAGGSAIVTGLRVCADNHVTVDRRQKDAVRLMLSLHAKGKLEASDFPVLRGHLSFLRNVAPAFYSKICLKYVETISPFI